MGELVNIRLANKNDIENLTKLHCNSFTPDEHIPVVFGRDYVRATYKWLVTSKIAYTLVAENNKNIVGLVAMCDSGFTLPMFIACVPEFLKSIIKSPSLMVDKKLWKRFIRQPDIPNKIADKIVKTRGVAQMTIGAVDQNFRGQSVFPLLISNTKLFSKNRGTRAIRAGVYKTNKPCRRAFEKDDWVEVSELETSDTVFFMAFLDETIAKDLGLVKE